MKILPVHSDSSHRLNAAVARGKHLNQLCGQPRWEIVLGHDVVSISDEIKCCQVFFI